MKKKIFAMSCIMLVLLVAIPSCNSQEIAHPTALNYLSFAHVVIDGGNALFFIGYHFIAGFGNCQAMAVNLEPTGHAKINKIFHPLNTVILDGNGIILLIGFKGYLKNADNGLNLNGVATFTVWS